jgi:hypothetical protein
MRLEMTTAAEGDGKLVIRLSQRSAQDYALVGLERVSD